MIPDRAVIETRHDQNAANTPVLAPIGVPEKAFIRMLGARRQKVCIGIETR